MPAQSKAQHRLMAASCRGESDAVPKSTACEFMHADKGKVKAMPERMGDLRGKKKEGSGWSKYRPR